jgi:hypothetical protein
MPLIWDLDDVLSLSVENQQPRRVRRKKFNLNLSPRQPGWKLPISVRENSSHRLIG